MKQYALLFDSDRCVSCKRCIVACREENNINGNWDRIFMTMRQPGGDFTAMEPLVQMCNHCETPGCIMACPVEGKAISKRPEDGIVLVNKEKCIGCEKCVKGCPYDLIQMSEWKNSRGEFVADKCTLCAHIIDKEDGKLTEDFGTPCVNICPVGALLFGTKDDLDKLVTWKGREADIMENEKGKLHPSNIYLKKRSIKKQFSF